MAEQLPKVTITTDGSARGNPGPGGWAALLEANGKEKLLSGGDPMPTTNNAMEVTAVAEALATLKRRCHVHLRCDSTYVLQGIDRILNGGTMAHTKFNRQPWAALEAQVGRHRIEVEWVKAHNGDPRNERVDQAANKAANKAALVVQSAEAEAHSNDDWLIILKAKGPQAEWLLRTPIYERRGKVAYGDQTELTNLYHALLAALAAAQTLPDSKAARLRVLSSLETLVKQGRGEWQVKQPAQKPLFNQMLLQRPNFAALDFVYTPNGELAQLLKASE